MSWIEELLRLTPDGGNGSLELSLFMATLASAAAYGGALVAMTLLKLRKTT